MRMSRVVAISLWTALLAISASAEEHEERPFSRPGFYVGVSGAFATDIFEDEVDRFVEDSFGTAVKVDIDPSWGVSGRLGYRWGGWFATEIQYEYIDEFKADLSVAGISAGGASLTAHTATLNGKLILPLWRTQPYLLAGVGGSLFDFKDRTPGGLLGGSDTREGFAGRAGAGIDLHLTHHLVINTEATALITTNDFKAPGVNNLDDLYYISASVGLQYRF